MSSLKITFRNLFRSGKYTLFNITGLTIGLTCALAIISWIRHELSYDRHLPESDRIYRLTFETNFSGNTIHFARCWETWVDQMPSVFPQIEELVRIVPSRHTALKIGEEKFYSDRVFTCDSNFFNVFNIDLLSGAAEDVMREPYSAVISSSIAKKCFGDENPVGKTILLSGEYDTEMNLYTVRGIMKDTPENSHIHFDVITSFTDPGTPPSWAYVYLMLREHTDPGDILAGIPSFIESVEKEHDTEDFTPHLQKITDIHLYSRKDREIEQNGNITGIYLFIAVSLLLLIISWSNYYNLNKARLPALRKQIDIRNIIGSGHMRILAQSLLESAVCVIISFAVSLVLLESSSGLSSYLLNVNMLPGGVSGLLNVWYIVVAILCISIFSGSLPVIIYIIRKELLYLHPVRGTRNRSGYGLSSYGLLMTVQFCISTILIAAAVTIYMQKEYLFSKSPGEMSSDILVFKKQNWEIRFKYETFRNRALMNPLIRDISASIEEPSGETVDALQVESPGIDKMYRETSLYILSVEDNFLDFFNLPIVAGRNFSRYNPDNKTEEYILNETAVRKLGWTPEEAVGQPFKINFDVPDIFYGGTVVGVVEDFYFSTLKQEIKPYVLFQKPIFYLSFLVDVDPARKEEAIDALKEIWEEELPDYPFQYEFICDLYKTSYNTELSQSRLTALFSFLAIVVICIGLISVTSAIVAGKTKEIGIRKVNGAMITDILLMFNSDFIRWLLIGYAIACPLALYAMNKWLQNFVYKTGIRWWIFPLTGVIILLITSITVSWQSWKSATRNPVEALRYE